MCLESQKWRNNTATSHLKRLYCNPARKSNQTCYFSTTDLATEDSPYRLVPLLESNGSLWTTPGESVTLMMNFLLLTGLGPPFPIEKYRSFTAQGSSFCSPRPGSTSREQEEAKKTEQRLWIINSYWSHPQQQYARTCKLNLKQGDYLLKLKI